MVMAYPSRRHRLELLQNLPFLLFLVFFCVVSLFVAVGSLGGVSLWPSRWTSLFFLVRRSRNAPPRIQTHNSAQQQQHAKFTLFLYTCARASFLRILDELERADKHTNWVIITAIRNTKNKNNVFVESGGWRGQHDEKKMGQSRVRRESVATRRGREETESVGLWFSRQTTSDEREHDSERF